MIVSPPYLARWWKIVWCSWCVIFILEGRALILHHRKNIWVVFVLHRVGLCMTHYQTRSQMLDLGGHTHRDLSKYRGTASCLLTKYCFCVFLIFGKNKPYTSGLFNLLTTHFNRQSHQTVFVMFPLQMFWSLFPSALSTSVLTVWEMGCSL